MGNKLTGDASTAVGSIGHSGDLVSSYQIGIALDGELEDRGRDGVVNGVLRIEVVDEGVDQAGVESVAGGNALQHVHVVSRGEPVLAALGVVEHTHPDGALDAGDVADDRGDPLAAVLGADLTGHLVGDCGRHAREVEGIDALENLVPVKDVALGHVDGGVLAVVDAAVAALRGTNLKYIGAKTVALANDARNVDVVGLQRTQGALTQTVGRNNGDVGGLVALVGQGKRGVGLGAAVADVKLGRLLNTQVSFGREPHHDLAEGKLRFTHGRVAPSCSCVHL